MVDEAIGRQPLLGYGYQAFWTEASSGAWWIWSAVGWMAPHAHNGLRDTMLSLGMAGVALLLIVIGRAVCFGAVLLRRARGDGWLWLNVLVAMFLTMNLTESLLLVQNNFFFTLFAAAIIMFGLHHGNSRTSLVYSL